MPFGLFNTPATFQRLTDLLTLNWVCAVKIIKHKMTTTAFLLLSMASCLHAFTYVYRVSCRYTGLVDDRHPGVPAGERPEVHLSMSGKKMYSHTHKNKQKFNSQMDHLLHR